MHRWSVTVYLPRRVCGSEWVPEQFHHVTSAETYEAARVQALEHWRGLADSVGDVLVNFAPGWFLVGDAAPLYAEAA